MIRRTHRTRYKRTFPTLAMIVLVFAVTWLLRELDVIDLKLPWLLVVLIIIVIGIIFNRLIG